MTSKKIDSDKQLKAEINKQLKEQMTTEEKGIVFKYQIMMALAVTMIAGLMLVNMFNP